MDQKIAEKLKRSVRKVEKCKTELSEAKGTDIPDAAEALIKAESAHAKTLAVIVESA